MKNLWRGCLFEESLLLCEGVHRVVDELHVDVDRVNARNAKLKKVIEIKIRIIG